MPKHADIVFLIDASTTMEPWLIAFRREIKGFLQHFERGANWGNFQIKCRTKVVGYRDIRLDGDRWFEDNPFVSDSVALQAQIDSLSARGGGNGPRSLLDAIYKVGSMKESDWSQNVSPDRWQDRRETERFVVIFTDAGFHPTMSLPEATGGGIHDVANLCVNNKLRLAIVAPDMPCFDDLSAIKKAEYVTICDEGEDPRGILPEWASAPQGESGLSCLEEWAYDLAWGTRRAQPVIPLEPTPPPLTTSIGYGNEPFDAFLERLRAHAVEYLIDVRSSATSRQAEFNGDALQRLLARESITYLDFGAALGGRPNDPSCYRDGHVDYDRCSERPVFQEALDRLVTGLEQGHRIALMCSEIDPERCHRSKLIGVELQKRGIPMTHIDRDGTLATQEQVIERLTGGQGSLFGEGFLSRGKYERPDEEPTRP